MVRDQAKEALEQYRESVFPGYQTAINEYLRRFNAGFRLDQIAAVDTRGGPTCTYNIVINDVPVPVAGGASQAGEPTFRNTLSSGDRNALALAFFFASLDQDPVRTDKIVVIDDPVSSLDDHRSLTTVEEIKKISESTQQVVVLSNSKSFLVQVWDRADRTSRSAAAIVRQGGSTITDWDVASDSITEHDRRHRLLREFLDTGTANSREIAESVRPVLEGFLRVAFPKDFPPGTLLGPFIHRCQQKVGSQDEILEAALIQELRELNDYAREFHHETNPTFWQTVVINETQLEGYVKRTLDFATR